MIKIGLPDYLADQHNCVQFTFLPAKTLHACSPNKVVQKLFNISFLNYILTNIQTIKLSKKIKFLVSRYIRVY